MKNSRRYLALASTLLLAACIGTDYDSYVWSQQATSSAGPDAQASQAKEVRSRMAEPSPKK